MKKILKMSFFLLTVLLTSGCADYSGNTKTSVSSEVSSEEGQKDIDISKYKVPSEVNKIAANLETDERFIPAENLIIEIGDYGYEKRMIVKLLKPDAKDSFVAVLDEKGKVMKYLFTGNNEIRMAVLENIDSPEAYDEINELFETDEAFNQEYQSAKFDYTIDYRPQNSEIAWSTTITAIKNS